MRPLIRCLMVVFITKNAPAQGTSAGMRGNEPSELTQLRRQFTLRALASSRTLADQYTKALAALEDQAGVSGDYETALAAQQRRQHLASWYASSGMESAESIVLLAADAKCSGPVTYERNEKVLEGWRSVGSAAAWDKFKLSPGTYTVTMTYGAISAGEGFAGPFGGGAPEDGPPPAGEVEFSEISGLGGAEAEKLTVQVRPTGGWTTYETITLGEIKILRTSARLMLKVSRLRANSGLLHLREIRLTPTKPTAAKPDDTAAKEYAEQRQAHVTRLAELGQPTLDSYLSRLQQISDDLAQKNDAEGVQAFLNESRRVQQSLHLLGKETPAEPGAAVSRIDGLDEIKDASYLPDPTNTGDRFLVSTKNQIMTVRLMSVSCPSPRAEDEEDQKRHASYFGITTDDSVAVGRQAREFTDAYLKERPLRILTRWMRDKSGAILAFVQPGEVGDFSGILVDNGLAAITSPQAKHGKHAEEAVRSALKEREVAAKAKALPPGAWSFSSVKSNP